MTVKSISSLLPISVICCSLAACSECYAQQWEFKGFDSKFSIDVVFKVCKDSDGKKHFSGGTSENKITVNTSDDPPTAGLEAKITAKDATGLKVEPNDGPVPGSETISGKDPYKYGEGEDIGAKVNVTQCSGGFLTYTVEFDPVPWRYSYYEGQLPENLKQPPKTIPCDACK